MANYSYRLFLAFLMVVTGSINTLSTKWADDTEAPDREGNMRKFEHPFTQASCMFIGEIMCFVAFKIMYFIYSRRGDGSEDVNQLTKGNRNFNPLLLLAPALCDMTATSIMYVGLAMTYASSFQMLRGSVIVFVGLLSFAFNQRRLVKRQWLGIAFVTVGLTIVGVADVLANKGNKNVDINSIITGDILIVIAQIITSIQMVVEEKYLEGQDIPPLQAVGWEGIFGFIVLGLLQIPFYFISVGPPFSNNARGVMEDAIEAIVQITHSYQLTLAILGTIISIAFFNFAGISITKEISATTRMVLDSVRTVVIWAVSLMFMGQPFYFLQLVGFIVLVTGMLVYNGISCVSIYKQLHNLVMHLRHRNRMGEDVIVNSAADHADVTLNA